MPPHRPLAVFSLLYTTRYVWTVVHIVDEASPLHQESWENLAAQGAELQVTFSGVDSESMEEISVSKRYTMGEVLFDAAFLPLLDNEDASVSGLRGNKASCFLGACMARLFDCDSALAHPLCLCRGRGVRMQTRSR